MEDAAKSLDQILALVDKFDTTVTNIVSSYAEANDVLSTRAKMLSKALARSVTHACACTFCECVDVTLSMESHPWV